MVAVLLGWSEWRLRKVKVKYSVESRFHRWAVTEEQIEKLKTKLNFHRSFVLSSFTGANIEEVSPGHPAG